MGITFNARKSSASGPASGSIKEREFWLNTVSQLLYTSSNGTDIILIQDPGTVPIGGIIAYNGSFSNIPPEYKLCNGQNGTPDLNDRFVFSTKTESQFKTTGGNNNVKTPKHRHTTPSHNHNSPRTTSQNGKHNHNVEVALGNSGNAPTFDATDYDHTGTSNPNIVEADGRHKHALSITSNFKTSTDGYIAGNNMPPYYTLAYIQRKS